MISVRSQEFPLLSTANPYHRADSLAELLSWHDVDFVRCAYVTVLGRQPDAPGQAYYAARLRMGRSRLEVLRQLRKSEEARTHDPGIAGFDRALRRARLQAIPVVGWIFRMFWPPVDSVAAGERRFRAAMNAIALNRSAICALAERMEIGQASHAASCDTSENRVEAEHDVGSPTEVISLGPQLARIAPKSPLAKFFARNAT